MNTFPCPHCGEPVADNARFCRACGADEDCGWGEDVGVDEGDYSEEALGDFDYDDFVAREFPDHADPTTVTSSQPRWVIFVILAIVVSLLLLMLPF